MSQSQKNNEERISQGNRPLSGSFNFALDDDNRRGSQTLKERYETLQQISEGSTATVWKAVDNKMNELVALKIAHKISTCGNLSAYFRQEAKVLQKMNHPNIIKVYDATSKYVSMELMSTCLFDYILENKNLSIPTILTLFAQIVQSVAHVHSKGYCHRDIKLENVLLNRTCTTPKLADFGFAAKSMKRIEALYPGSPDYLAPEVAWKRPYDGMSYDMWSLGILLYAMASRRFPFSKPSESNDLIVSRIRSFESFETTISRNHHEFSPEIESLLKRLLLKDPASRATAQSLLEDPILTPYIIKEEAQTPIKEMPKTKSRFSSFVERGLSRISLTLADRFVVKSVDTQTQSEKSQVSQASQ